MTVKKRPDGAFFCKQAGADLNRPQQTETFVRRHMSAAAAAIEQTANKHAQLGWELVTFSVTNSAKAILVFRVPENACQK